MSKAKHADDLRPEYDLGSLGRATTGKYYRSATAGTNLVLLDPDVAKAFPDAAAVNRALRLLMEIAASKSIVSKRRSVGRAPRPAAALGKRKRSRADSGE